MHHDSSRLTETLRRPGCNLPRVSRISGMSSTGASRGHGVGRRINMGLKRLVLKPLKLYYFPLQILSKTSWLISEINQSMADAHGGRESTRTVDSQWKIQIWGDMARNAEISEGKKLQGISFLHWETKPRRLIILSLLLLCRRVSYPHQNYIRFTPKQFGLLWRRQLSIKRTITD